MQNQERKPRSFGAADRLVCPKCREQRTLTRRSPDSDYGQRYERQTFLCSACDYGIDRSVDADGISPELVRY